MSSNVQVVALGREGSADFRTPRTPNRDSEPRQRNLMGEKIRLCTLPGRNMDVLYRRKDLYEGV